MEVAILNRVVLVGLIEEVTLSRLEGSEGVSPDIYGNKENGQCKGPGVGSASVCWRKNEISRTTGESWKSKAVAVFSKERASGKPFGAHVATARPCKMRVTETLEQRRDRI